MLSAYGFDTVLAPLGLLAAFPASRHPEALLLLLPMVLIVARVGREREEKNDKVLELKNAYQGTTYLLGDMIESDDAYTGSHSRDVVDLVLAVAERLGLDADEQRMAEFTALLHDVGKLRIPSEIINKPGPLDDEERALMNTHTILGQEMLERAGGLLGEVGPYVRSCHEHWDGNGYPDGLAGEAIPLVARIVCTCDAWSAMTTDRSYRKALSHEAAVAELRKVRRDAIRSAGRRRAPRRRSSERASRRRSRPRSTRPARAPSPGGSRSSVERCTVSRPRAKPAPAIAPTSAWFIEVKNPNATAASTTRRLHELRGRRHRAIDLDDLERDPPQERLPPREHADRDCRATDRSRRERAERAGADERAARVRDVVRTHREGGDRAHRDEHGPDPPAERQAVEDESQEQPEDDRRDRRRRPDDDEVPDRRPSSRPCRSRARRRRPRRRGSGSSRSACETG